METNWLDNELLKMTESTKNLFNCYLLRLNLSGKEMYVGGHDAADIVRIRCSSYHHGV